MASESVVTIKLSGAEYRFLMMELQYVRDGLNAAAKTAPHNSDGRRQVERAARFSNLVDRM